MLPTFKDRSRWTGVVEFIKNSVGTLPILPSPPGMLEQGMV